MWKTAVWKDSSLHSHPDECFIHHFDLFGRGLPGRRCLFACLTSSNASASHLSPEKPLMSQAVTGSTSGSVRGRARNDSRHVAAVKIYMNLMLLSQAGLVKAVLAISLVKEAKAASSVQLEFWRAQVQTAERLYKRLTGSESYQRFWELWMRTYLGWSNVWDKWGHEGRVICARLAAGQFVAVLNVGGRQLSYQHTDPVIKPSLLSWFP